MATTNETTLSSVLRKLNMNNLIDWFEQKKYRLTLFANSPCKNSRNLGHKIGAFVTFGAEKPSKFPRSFWNANHADCRLCRLSVIFIYLKWIKVVNTFTYFPLLFVYRFFDWRNESQHGPDLWIGLTDPELSASFKRNYWTVTTLKSCMNSGILQ